LFGASAASAAVPELLQKGDAAFRVRTQDPKALEALESYRTATKETQRKDPETLWREAMACYFVGMRVEKDRDKKEALYAEGRDAGEAAAEMNPHCAACHFWAAINMALYGQSVGVFKMLFSLDSIEKHLKASIAEDPSYAGAGAYRLLGLIDQKLPGILGGSNKRAREYFEKAIAAFPYETLNYLFLARLLKNQLDDSEGAMKQVRLGVAVPADKLPQPESFEAQADLRNMLAHPKAKEWE
jgi:tetratricopeptide (TPR) repeat protein